MKAISLALILTVLAAGVVYATQIGNKQFSYTLVFPGRSRCYFYLDKEVLCFKVPIRLQNKKRE